MDWPGENWPLQLSLSSQKAPAGFSPVVAPDGSAPAAKARQTLRRGEWSDGRSSPLLATVQAETQTPSSSPVQEEWSGACDLPYQDTTAQMRELQGTERARRLGGGRGSRNRRRCRRLARRKAAATDKSGMEGGQAAGARPTHRGGGRGRRRRRGSRPWYEAPLTPADTQGATNGWRRRARPRGCRGSRARGRSRSGRNCFRGHDHPEVHTTRAGLDFGDDTEDRQRHPNAFGGQF